VGTLVISNSRSLENHPLIVDRDYLIHHNIVLSPFHDIAEKT